MSFADIPDLIPSPMVSDRQRDLARRVSRLLDRDPYEAESLHQMLVEDLDGDERAACRLLTDTLLADTGLHWPESLASHIAGFAHRQCRDTGIDPAATIHATVGFAVDMIVLNRGEDS